MSALALKRPLGVSYPTAGLIPHQRMPAMAERAAADSRCGQVQEDDADLGGERAGGQAGRGSENQVPFVAAVSPNAAGHPLSTKLTPVPGFTRNAIADGAKAELVPGCSVISEGLAGFAGVAAAGCQPQAVIVGARKPKDWPEFSGVNPVLGNLKTSFSGAYPAFDFAK